VPFGSNVASGSLLVAVCSIYQDVSSASAPVFTDSLSSTWTIEVNTTPGGGTATPSRIYAAWAITSAGGANSVTCNPPGTSDFITVVAIEYSGIATSSPRDQLTVGDFGGTPSDDATSGTTGTTVQANEVLVGAMTFNDGATATLDEVLPLTLVEEEENHGLFAVVNVSDLLLSATGTYTATWTIGDGDDPRDWVACAVTFKEAGVVVRRPGKAIWFQ
jgi:hypothetical protein